MGAISVPIDEIDAYIQLLPRDIEFAAYCRGPFCVYSAEVVKKLQAKDFPPIGLKRGTGVDQVYKKAQTLEELLAEELIWERQEGEIDLFDWWDKGIRLYKQLLRLDPGNERFRVQLANLLLKAGGDLKMRQHHFSQAQRLFRELIKLEPLHALANYRMGFLAYYDQKWSMAVHYFERALRGNPAKLSQQINREQRMKALCYLAKAYQNMSLETFEQANQMWSDERDPIVADAVEPFIDETRNALFSYGDQKPYVFVTRSDRRCLDEQEALDFQAKELACDEIRLDLLGEKYFLIFRRDVQIELSEQLARLLQLLMEQMQPVSRQTIKDRLFPDSRSDSVVRRTVQRLREALRHSLLPDDLIQTTDFGYRWNWPGEFQIFYRKDDIFLADMIDV
ncbi:winged helix-turn-helix domain-containing protein [Brevibacillus sp. B_LB10_24]|uniref:winged helix-turn-helix domain-containing protein n=1 Tax=Brevibacillus sp. B_LB10_24 TaxID=3380645 RepID=UPI0038BC9649